MRSLSHEKVLFMWTLAIHTTLMPIMPLIGTTLVRIHDLNMDFVASNNYMHRYLCTCMKVFLPFFYCFVISLLGSFAVLPFLILLIFYFYFHNLYIFSHIK